MLWVNKRPSKEELCQVHIDKKGVIPDKWRNALITNQLSKTWDNYFKKLLRPYRAQGTIFGTEAKGEKVEERRTWI